MSAEHLAAYTAEDVGACADAVNNILGKTLAINPSKQERSHDAQLRHSRLSIFYVRELAALQPWGPELTLKTQSQVKLEEPPVFQ